MNKNIENLHKTYADIAKTGTSNLDPLNKKVEELEESLNKISQELRTISTQIFQHKEALKYAYTNHSLVYVKLSQTPLK